MSRDLVVRLLSSTIMLALSGCGQVVTTSTAAGTNPTSAPVSAAQPLASTAEPLPPTQSSIQPSAVPVLPATAGPTQPSTSIPNTTPVVPTSATEVPIAHPQTQATSTARLLTMRGEITGLDPQNMSLVLGNKRIIWTDQTRVFVLAKAMPLSSLRVGRSISVEAHLNAQGLLVAERITLQPTQIRKPGPPPPG